ncbi:MAG: DUF2635 domain-containing protein [Polaromonas sp.]
MNRIFIKPATGLLVRKPVNGHLKADGEEVNAESYWLRRIADGDVTELPLPSAGTEPHQDTPSPKATLPAKAKAA